MPDIIRGNRSNLILTLKLDGIPVATLAAALSVRFVARNVVNEICIDKDLADGLIIDSPVVGNVTVPLISVDTTNLDEGRYEMAIQCVWGAGDLLEWRFSERLVILREIIPQE